MTPLLSKFKTSFASTNTNTNSKLSDKGFIKRVVEFFKEPKRLLILGLCGIVLIFVSSVFKGEDKTSLSQQSITTEEYRKILEESVLEIVREITGDKRAVVVVTLENGMRYSYADATVTDAENFEGKDSTQESSSASKSYITIRTADGGEKALIVTEYMPDVRGVAIVCSGGDNEQIAQKIKGAVTAALHITSKRVYITGGT